MSNKEKHHTSHRTSMLHLRYLASFMDEIDREVVSLTDRAFKSLCIGDEAIYNDSEFSPSPVSCHKPRVEEVSKKTQESSCSAVKKLHSYTYNGGKDALGKSNQNTSHFAMFSAKKNSDCIKMTNGDSWDKSALLSIQKELSEFSSDYHSLMVEQLSSDKNNLNSDEKGSAKKSSKDALIPSGKKCKHNKNNKLKKLNSKNFFLHSEFSPFLSWRDLNTFSIGQDHISEIMLGNRQSEWYDSPLYKELTAAHEHYKLHVTPSEDNEVEKCPKQTETHQVKEQPVQSTSPTTPPNLKKETECVQHDIVTKAPLLATEQRCNSEKVETCVPWRKNKARAKSAVPVGPSLNTFPVYERSKAGEGSTQPIEKEVKTIDDQTSSNSTPFSISQLLTPVIPSRHGTGTSDILQAVLPSTALDILPLPEREMHPSPEIKREGYKSMASSLLFNLKDNRKRVKAMYSPSKFKGLDVPLSEVSSSKDVLEIPEVSKATTISPARQKSIISPMSPVLESADTQNCSPHGLTNGGVPDDYLALSLLQSGGSANRPLKSNRSPLANKVAYPSLQLYRKSSPEENNLKTNCQTVVNTTSQVFTDKRINLDHIRDRDTHSNPRKFVQNVNKEQRDKTPTVSLNTERVYFQNKSGKSPCVSSTKSDEQTISDGTHQNKDRLETSTTVSMQKSPVEEKESNRKKDKAKHLFSARQNNFIKSQRFVINDDDNNDYDDDSSNADKVLLAVKDINGIDELSRHSKDAKLKEIGQDECNTGFHEDNAWTVAPILKESANVKEKTMTEKQSGCISIINSETQREQVKNEPLSMKGNTFAKRALFTSMEQVANEPTVPFKKDNIVIDKYDLAKMALEEVIADREQRKLKGKVVSTEASLIIDRNIVGCDGHELSTKGDDQQTFSSKMGTNTKDGKGQNTASAFKTSSQVVQMMSEDVVTKHSDSQESNRDKVNMGDKTLRLPEKGHAKVGTNRGDHSECRDIHSSAQSEQELGIKKNGSSHTPEVPPRRGRSHSDSNHTVVEKTIRNKELKREGDTSVKSEEIESRQVSKIRRSQSKNRGPVKGNVSALKEKYDKESGVHRKDVQKCQSVGSTSSEKSKEERPNDQPAKDQIKHKTIIPKLTVSSPESETCSTIHKQKGLGNKRTSENTSKEECGSQREHNDTQNFQKTIGDLANNRQEMQDFKVNGTEKEEEGSDKLNELGNSRIKSKGPCKSYVKELTNGLLGHSSAEKVESVGEHQEDLTEEAALSFEADQNRKDSIAVHDILEQSPSLWSLNGKQTHHSSLSSKEKELSLSNKYERGSQSHLELLSSNADVYNIKEKADGKVEEDFPKSRLDSFTFGNHESESDISDRVVSPQTDVEKRGWVHCLIESARHLTQVSHSTSPKDLPEITQPRSQETRNGEEDLECFKDCVHSQVALPAIPDKSPQPNQPAMHLLSPPATQLTLVKEGKLSVGSASLSEEEEPRSAVSTLSEGVDSFETSAGDTMDNIISSTSLADAEGSMAPSERSGSVCSGNDSHGQSKPPSVPPKTEKAMRRAMKLTTRRIQKADAKSKSERKGRSSDKSISHKAERRHHSTDKIEGDRSECRSISDDRHSNKHEHYLEPKTQRSEKHYRCHSSHKSQNVEESDPSNKRQDGQPNKVVDSNSHSNEKQHQKSNHMDHLENSDKSNDIDRTSRNNEKYVPKRRERRTQSLDRFSRDENKSNSFDITEAEVNSGLSKEELHYSTSKAQTLRQNSIEHTYAPTANIVAQSFPITQRKLLQDPDSGQYFLVDMPVQVKTKTFFDPETKSYVQLPVQSPEGAVRPAPPLEVMNTPPLVLYHGFVPVPVSSLPSQKSIVRTTGSMITPDDLEDFETGKKQDFYQMQEVHPYIEPAYLSQEHTPEEEIDSVR